MDDLVKSIQPFECDKIPATEQRQKWIDFKRQFSYYAKTLTRVKKKRIKSLFLAVAGRALQKVWENLEGMDPESAEVAGNDDETADYHLMIEKLDLWFAPKQHDIMERFNFHSMKPEESEPLDKFLVRVTAAANRCNFGQTLQESRDTAVCDKILMEAPKELRKKMLERDSALTLEALSKLLFSFLSVENNVTTLNESINAASTSSMNNSTVNQINHHKTFSQNRAKCGNCGLDSHKNRQECRAMGVTCRNCGKENHYARVCRSARQQGFPSKSSYSGKNPDASSSQSNTSLGFQENRKRNYQSSSNQNKRQRVNNVESDSENRPEEDFVNAIGDDQNEKVWVKIGGIMVEMLIDSGSKYNIIDERTWKLLVNGKANIKNTRNSKKKLSAYAQPDQLEILCCFEASLEVHGSLPTLDCEYYVVRGGRRNLLGKDTSMKLGILRIGIPEPSGSENIPDVCEIHSETFPCIKDVVVHIDMDPQITPVVQRVRRVPLAMRQSVEEELQRMLKSGVIEPVKRTSAWVSPLVPVVNGPGRGVRICLDLRAVNEGVRRKYHMIPTLDEILSGMSGAKFFSILDVKKAYWQCMLAENSREYTTFITHIGMFRFTRLPFGISNAPETFQSVLEQILSGIKNQNNFQDDIIIYGRTEIEHDNALKEVLGRLKENNVMLNQEKCKIKLREVEFLGHRLTQEGVTPGTDYYFVIHGLRGGKLTIMSLFR